MCETIKKDQKGFLQQPQCKIYWKTVKPSFTNKTFKDERITLVENFSVQINFLNYRVVSYERELTELTEINCKYFGKIPHNLRIDGLTITSSDNTVSIRKVIEKYQKPS